MNRRIMDLAIGRLADVHGMRCLALDLLAGAGVCCAGGGDRDGRLEPSTRSVMRDGGDAVGCGGRRRREKEVRSRFVVLPALHLIDVDLQQIDRGSGVAGVDGVVHRRILIRIVGTDGDRWISAHGALRAGIGAKQECENDATDDYTHGKSPGIGMESSPQEDAGRFAWVGCGLCGCQSTVMKWTM